MNSTLVDQINSTSLDQNFTEPERDFLIEVVNFYVNDIVGSIIFSLGILFNLTSLIYFQLSRSFYDTSMRHYFSVLSVTDSLRLSEWLFSYLLDKQIIYLSKNLCSSFLFITITSGHISIWLLVFLSIERYIILQFPFKGKQFYTIKNSLRMLCLVIVILVIFDIPYLLPNFIVGTWISYEYHVHICRTDPIYRTYMFVNNILFYSLIPFVILLIFNCLLISLLSRSNTQLLNMTQDNGLNMKRERQVKERTILLISVTFFLVLTVSPRYIFQMIIVVTKFSSEYKIPIAKCFFILEMLNFGSNFLFYTICSKTSRNELYLILYYYLYWIWSKNYRKYPICNHPNHNTHINTSERMRELSTLTSRYSNCNLDYEMSKSQSVVKNSKNSKSKIHCFLANATRLRALKVYEAMNSPSASKSSSKRNTLKINDNFLSVPTTNSSRGKSIELTSFNLMINNEQSFEKKS